jgi:hypothetical protein
VDRRSWRPPGWARCGWPGRFNPTRSSREPPPPAHCLATARVAAGTITVQRGGSRGHRSETSATVVGCRWPARSGRGRAAPMRATRTGWRREITVPAQPVERPVADPPRPRHRGRGCTPEVSVSDAAVADDARRPGEGRVHDVGGAGPIDGGDQGPARSARSVTWWRICAAGQSPCPRLPASTAPMAAEQRRLSALAARPSSARTAGHAVTLGRPHRVFRVPDFRRDSDGRNTRMLRMGSARPSSLLFGARPWHCPRAGSPAAKARSGRPPTGPPRRSTLVSPSVTWETEPARGDDRRSETHSVPNPQSRRLCSGCGWYFFRQRRSPRALQRRGEQPLLAGRGCGSRGPSARKACGLRGCWRRSPVAGRIDAERARGNSSSSFRA